MRPTRRNRHHGEDGADGGLEVGSDPATTQEGRCHIEGLFGDQAQWPVFPEPPELGVLAFWMDLGLAE